MEIKRNEKMTYPEDFINKVIQSNCLIEMPKIPDKSINMILCDLPYGTTACKWDTIIPFEPLWKEYKRIIKDNGAIVLTASQPFTSALVMSNPKWFRYEIIWEKERPTNIFFMKKQIAKVHENILVFYKHQPKYNPQMEKSLEPENNKHKIINNTSRTHEKQKYVFTEGYNNKVRYPRSVQKINRDRFNALHPTQKPVALFEYLIKTYTSVGDTILDNCIGSGTTAVAAINTGRNFIGIEMDKGYCEIANKRISEII